ncbi:PD-(D/E)XK nuclease family protein [Polyangium aurulentum]|uniref:PD-(D/E)XK nuclease family protein n=1 Tax=Polyangium aurulentum TaxID=2567896 RepID=UPI0010AE8D69|nr:PD-(D/E)XK nuclease family protein [Polyangium aurulentum]
MLRLLVSPRSAERISAAEAFLGEGSRGAEALILAPSRGAALDLASRVGVARGANFGLHRTTLGELAERLAAPELARRRLAPATPLGTEAIVARAVFDALAASSLRYFAPVARAPSFARTLAATLEELRLEGVSPEMLHGDEAPIADVRDLARRYDEHRARAALADRADVLEAAARAAEAAPDLARAPLVLLDVPVASRAEERFVAALVAAAPRALATVPAGDDRAESVLSALASAHVPPPSEPAPVSLARLHQHLFDAEELSPAEAGDDVSFFSAPGEGRECVEIARRILDEAHGGVPFDDIAVFLRAAETYAPLLESALRRAGIPAHFAVGASRPEPAGRALLALLACRAEDLSAKRFAEYLSLAQVPPGEASSEGSAATSTSAPRGWEKLLTEASIVAGKERWGRRLDALGEAFAAELEVLRENDPASPRIENVEREVEELGRLRRFALPLVEALAALPARARWSVWLEALEQIAGMALADPEPVRAALAELKPMAEVGPVSFDEMRRALEGRIGTRATPPAGRRYGAVYVAPPELARGRTFAVVFVPGLAERLFPEAPREDPILLDTARRAISPALLTQADRSRRERLLLRLAVGAARKRVHLSYPRVEVAAARSRVPSFYGLDVRRATTGTIPDHDALEREAASASGARLAWPAPIEPEGAIDDAEHDLSVLARLLHEGDAASTAGRARYLLGLNPHLARSLRARSARWEPSWSQHDGIVRRTEGTARALEAQRLRTKPYAVTAIEKFAACPYRFLLSAIHRLPGRERRSAVDRMDPITRGILFHNVQAKTLAALDGEGALPIVPERLARATAVLDEQLDLAARDHEERTAPPAPRVFLDEIERIRADLRAWLGRLVEESDHLHPERYDLSFGLPAHEHEDPRSVSEPAVLEGGFMLHGAIDVVERHATSGRVRVTDVKTGTNFTRPGMVIGGGEVLQPVLYGLAYEAVWKERVADARLLFCTARGGQAEHVVPLDDRARRHALSVVTLVDEAIDRGFFPPAPRDGACDGCAYRVACGPHEERRAGRKDEASIEGGALFEKLRALREEP